MASLLMPYALARADAIPGFSIATTGADPVATATATTYYCTTNNCTTSGTRTLWTDDYPLELKALADALGKDADRIYAFVHDNIEIVPMFGLQKGALGALIDRSGTAFDQAHLMVELLRQSGYTAGFVRGTITITGDQLQAWLGTKNLAAAKRLLADGGIPADVTASGSDVGSVTLMHMWVQVAIGGTTYVFDPAFKTHTRTAPLNLSTAMGWNETTFLSAAQSGMTSGTQTATSGSSGSGSVSIPYVANLNVAGAESQLTSYANTLVGWLRTNGHAAEQIEDLIGRQDIDHASSTPLRQTSLSYGSAAATLTGNIPNIFRTRLVVEMLKLTTQATLLSQTLYADEIYGRRVLFDTYLDSFGWTECTVRMKVNGRYVGPLYSCTDRPDGRRAYVRLAIDHPYAANSGAWLDLAGSNRIVKMADFTSPVAIVFGLGDVSDRLPAKLAAEQEHDRLLPESTFYQCNPLCETIDNKARQPNQESAIVQAYAGWLAQYQQMAMLQSRSLGSFHQLHHSLGVAYRRGLVTLTNPKPGDVLGDAEWTASQGALVLDIDSAASVTSGSNTVSERRALALSLEASADTLEASIFEQSGSATPASVAHRFSYTSANTASTRYYLLTNAATTDDFFPRGPGPSFYPSIYSGTATYTSASYKVIVSADEFMGPGRQCPISICTPQNILYFERGAAFQAFAPDGVGLASIVTNVWGDGFKGGSAGDPPVYETEYTPDKSAGLLKDAFKDRSRDLGIDLASGDFTYSPGTDVSVGLGDFPYKLSLQRNFKPAASHSPGLGRGWTHSLDYRLELGSSGMEAMGQHSTLAAASTLVALHATRQLYATLPGTDLDLLKRWIVAPLVQAWWAGQIRFNTVTATSGGSAQVFTRLPDGSFLPPGGWKPGDSSSYRKLVQTGAPTGYGTKWTHANVNFTLTSAAKDVQTYGHWVRLNSDIQQPYLHGFHHGWHLTSWTWPQGVSLALGYIADGSNNDDLLTSVQNSLGRKINLSFGSGVSDWDACNFLSANDNNSHTTSYSCATATTTRPVNAYGQTTEVSKVVYGEPNCGYGLWPDRSRRPRCVPYLTQVYGPSDTAHPKARVEYDAAGAVKTYSDAQAILAPGSREPYQFRIADGLRGERLDPAGHAYAVDYDAWGRAVRYTDELGRASTASYDGLGRVLQRVSPGGVKTNFQYDFRGQVTQLQQVPSRTTSPTVPASLTVSATYDSGCGKLKTVTDAKGNVTTWNYNATTCLVTSVAQPAVPNAAVSGSPSQAPTTQFAYTAAGLIDYLIDPSGVKVDYTYDASGNRTQRQVDPAGVNQSTSYGYDAVGNITSVTDGRSKTTSYLYDDSRRVYRVTGHSGTCLRTDVFYTGGLRTAVKSARQCSPNVNTASHWQTTTTTYTATDQPGVVTDPDGNTTKTLYDALDRPVDVVQQIAANNFRTTRTVYDAAGQTLQTIRAFGNADQITYATYTYTPDGQVATTADANGNVTTAAYDGYDRPWRTCFPGTTNCGATPGGAALYEQLGLDANGNVTSHRNRDGKSITAVFDALDRETTRTVPANGAGHFARTLTTNYDLASRKWDVTADGQTLSHRYDGAGRLDTVSDSLLGALGTNVGTLDYAYDAAGNRASAKVYSLGTSWTPQYAYDDAERLASVASGGTTHASLSYDILSRLSGITFADASTTAVTYENDDDLATLAHTYSGGGLSWGYSHNGAHQITSATVSDNSFENKSGTSTSYSVNALNQYTAVGSTSPTYDANGNLTSDGTWTFEYDEENRLRSATKTGTTATYEYDPLGRRRSKTVNGTTTYFVNDGADEVAELDGTGTRTRLYVNGSATDQHLAVYAGAWRYVHVNHQGSVVLTTNASGIVGSFSYGPYGESAAAGNAFGYTGRYLDAETGLYYYRARFYSAALGRFLQTDPIGGDDDLNPYAYAGGDAVNGSDPLGTETEDKPDVSQSIATGTHIKGSEFVDGHSTQLVIGAGSTQSHSTGTASPPSKAANSPGGPYLEVSNQEMKAAGAVAAAALAVAGTAAVAPELGPAVAGAAARVAAKGTMAAAETAFKTAHYASRLEAAGVNIARVETAVAKEVNAMRGGLATNADVVGRLTVDGVKVEYRARLLPNGTVNVGTLFPVK